MRNSSVLLSKVALVRDESYPVGTPAPLFLRCHCGARPSVTGEVITCYGCGTKYTRTGWVVEDRVLN